MNGVAKLYDGEALVQLKENSTSENSTQYHKKVVFAQHGNPGNGSRTVGVSFSHNAKSSKPLIFPATGNNRGCAGDVIKCSTQVPARFGDDMQWFEVGRS